jgi:acid phosphatase
VPFSQFATDLSNGTLPTISFVVPNICNDMKGNAFSCFTGLVQTGDTWLNTNISPFLAAPVARNSLLILTWDEGSGLSASDQIPTIFAGAHVQHGFSSAVAITHYSVLRTLEDMYHVVPQRNAATASAITDVWDDVIFADMFE